MKKVLVIDDDPNLAELIKDFCEQSGYVAKCISDSTKAFEIVMDWKPDLVTLDLQMPGIDGEILLRQIRTTPETSNIPVVVVSVIAKNIADAGRLAGAHAVFSKPLLLKLLMAKIKALLK